MRSWPTFWMRSLSLGAKCPLTTPSCGCQAVAFGDRDHLVHFVDVEVAACPVVGLEQRRHGLVPALQHAFLARVGRVEVDARLGAADGRAGDAELDLHGLCQRLDLTPVETRAHARATTGSTTAQ
jgi:hypothetical protein